MLVIPFITACSYGTTVRTGTDQLASPVGRQAADMQAVSIDNKVSIQNFAFSPGVLTVKKGTTVIWTNDDAAPHQVKSAVFNSSVLNTGDSFTFTFNEAGSYDYICSIHPSMKGTIIVQ